MTTFTPAASWADLFAQDTPRSYGVILSPADAFQSKLSVQIGVRNTNQSMWDTEAGGWDELTWDDTNYASWVDITARVRGLEWDRGSTDPISQPEVGTATLTLDNQDGEVSPWATSGPFTNPVDSQPVWDLSAWDESIPGSASSLIRPGAPMRFGVTLDDSEWLPFFTGLIESIDEDSQDNVDAWVTITLVDIGSALAAIGQGNGTTGGGLLVDGAVGDNMLTGLLADIAWPYALDAFIGSTLFVTAAYQVPDVTQNRLEAAQQLCISGNATLIASSAGTIGPVDRGFHTDSGFIFSNDPAGGELPLVALTPYSSTDRILNVATGTRVGGTAQTATDPVSVDQFGVQANALGWPQSDLLLHDDGDVLTLAGLVVDSQSEDFLGISSIDVDADQAPTSLFFDLSTLATAGIETQGRFAVRWVHPSGNVFEVDVWLLGFSHSITMQGNQAKWVATLRTATLS